MQENRKDGGVMQENRKDDLEGTLAVADVETTMLKDGERPKTLFWGLAIEGEGYRKFKTTKAFWKFLESRRDTLLIYHHHDFDVIQVLADGFPLKPSRVRNGRVMLSSGPGKHQWRNSYMLFPTKLADILESCGFVKPGLDDLEARNVADTVDALKAFRMLDAKYLALWDIAPLSQGFLTAASVAFASAELEAGPVPEWIKDRTIYRGGRTEAFHMGRCGSADLWDINSSYPYSFLDAEERDTLYYLDVTVSSRKHISPFFVLGAEKLLFPVGRFPTAVWESNYERYIAPHGGIKRVRVEKKVPYSMKWLRRVAHRLSRVYTIRLKAKQSGDSALAYAAKIGLNSVYGRLGMRPEREVAYVVPKLPLDEEITYYRMPMDSRGAKQFLLFRKFWMRPKANYLFASFITCNARARLYDAMMRVKEPLYCDTDSIYCPEGDIPGVPIGSQLGAWKFEGTEDLAVESVKDYVFGTRAVRKGGASSFTWTLKSALPKGQGGPVGVVKEVQKHRITPYDKRDVLPSGETLPIQL